MNIDRALIIDGLIVAVYFVVIVRIGLRAGRNTGKLEDFTVGGRSIPWWAALASIIAAETSAATFLGTPAEGFKNRSFVYGQLVIGTVLARLVIAYLFLKPYYHYRVQSVYEFLSLRFGPRTRDLASATFMVTRVLGIGVRLYLGGAIIVVIWRYLLPDLPVPLATYFWGILFVATVTAVYTAVGGIKAVVWTDLIQASLMLCAVVVAIVLLFRGIPEGISGAGDALGGWENVSWFQTGWDSELSFGSALAGMLEEPYTLFAAFIGSTFLTLATHGTDQDMVQRMLTAPDYHKARRALVLSGLADIPVVIAFLTVGLLLYAHYQNIGHAGLPEADNEIFAYFIVNEIPAGLRGLVLAGVFGSMMGSTSAALNALATSFVRDFYQPYFQRGTGDGIRAARVATIVFAVLMVLVATVAASAVLKDAKLTIIPLAIGILGYTYGGLLAVFFLGMLTRRRGSDWGNVFAMMLGNIAVFVLGKVELFGIQFGGWLPQWWPKIAWSWYVFIGCAVALPVAALFRSTERR